MTIRFLKDCLLCDSEARKKKVYQASLSPAKPQEEDKATCAPAGLSPTSALFAEDQTIATKPGRTKRTMKELKKQTRKVQTSFQPDCFQDRVYPVNGTLPTEPGSWDKSGYVLWLQL